MINYPPDYRREGRQEFMFRFFWEHQSLFVKPVILPLSMSICNYCYIIIKALVFFMAS